MYNDGLLSVRNAAKYSSKQSKFLLSRILGMVYKHTDYKKHMKFSVKFYHQNFLESVLSLSHIKEYV